MRSSSATIIISQRRWFSFSDDGEPTSGDEPYLVYDAQYSGSTRLTQGGYVAGSCLAAGSPLLSLINGQPLTDLDMNSVLAHYQNARWDVRRMWLDKKPLTDNALVTVETLTYFAQTKRHRFRLGDVMPPHLSENPLISFRANDFYIEPDQFKDDAVLLRFTGLKLQDDANDNDKEYKAS